MIFAITSDIINSYKSMSTPLDILVFSDKFLTFEEVEELVVGYASSKPVSLLDQLLHSQPSNYCSLCSNPIIKEELIKCEEMLSTAENSHICLSNELIIPENFSDSFGGSSGNGDNGDNGLE